MTSGVAGGGEAEPVMVPVTAAETDVCLELLRAQGWNQLRLDLELFMEQGTSLAMFHQGRAVATGSIISWDDQLAWIGMVLTVPEMRGRSLATRLMREMLDRYRHVRSIKLDASAMGAPIYRRLGFIEEQRLIRFSAASLPDLGAGADLHWEPLTAGNLAEAMALEERFTGWRRVALWDYYRRCHARLGWLGRSAAGGPAAACFCGRPGRLFQHLGPLCAESLPQAVSALRHFSRQLPGLPLQLDVPETQTGWVELLSGAGFRRERDFLRMHFGAPCGDWSDRKVYAVFGPEMG